MVVSNLRFDRELEAAEARLDRLDDRDERRAQHAVDLDEAEVMATGMHIDEGEPVDVQDGNDDGHTFDGGLVDAIDAFTEAFNARDLDAVLDLVADDVEAPGLGGDRTNLPSALGDLWDRHPTAILTRGELDGTPVAVLWDVGEDGHWWRLAPVLFDGVADGRLAMVELTDDPDTAAAATAAAPDDEFDEGARWEEWESGVSPE